jgi:hypothetical protein
MREKRADRDTQVRAQLDYHRRRLDLYRELHGSRPCARLSELELAYDSARNRLTGGPQHETSARDGSGLSPRN